LYQKMKPRIKLYLRLRPVPNIVYIKEDDQREPDWLRLSGYMW